MNPVIPVFPAPSLALIGDVGGGEVAVILAAILVLFGGKGLPGIARSLGKITRDLQRASQEFKEQLLSADTPETKPAPPCDSPADSPAPPKENPPRDPAG